jgi:HSP20 family protein
MPLIPYFSQTPTARHRWRENQSELNDLLRAFWGVDQGAVAAWAPRLDVHESKDAYVVQADLPGVDKKDIQVSVEDGVLTLRGERKIEREDKAEDGAWHRVERRNGSFQRSLHLGEGVDVDQVKADYKDGVLTVQIPKKEAAKPKQITIG